MCKSHFSPCLSRSVRDLSWPVSRRHPLRSSHRHPSFLNHHLSRGAVQHKQGTDSETLQDYSARCDVLFPGYIHFTPSVRDVSGVRKCKDIVIILRHLSAAHLDLYSLVSNNYLAGKLFRDAFHSFFHWPCLRAVVEPSCMSEYLFTF
jgi:hypothetical protein